MAANCGRQNTDDKTEKIRQCVYGQLFFELNNDSHGGRTTTSAFFCRCSFDPTAVFKREWVVNIMKKESNRS
jgi:hypothetical protein